jgi:hypothetical protein
MRVLQSLSYCKVISAIGLTIVSAIPARALIYFSPPLIFTAFLFASIPNHGFYPLDIFFIVFLIGFLILVFAYPLLIGVFGLWLLLPFLLLYYGGTYGLLLYYWKRKDRNQKDAASERTLLK